MKRSGTSAASSISTFFFWDPRRRSCKLKSLGYVLYDCSPSIWASVGDVLERRNIYLSSMLIYVGASIGIGLCNNYGGIAALRSLQALISSPITATGVVVISDIYSPSERGLYIGIFSVGVQLGPSTGPIFAALTANRWGWHAIFYFLASLGGTMVLLVAFFVPETLHSIVWNGSVKPSSRWRRSWISLFRSGFGVRYQFSHSSFPKNIPDAPRRKSYRDIRPWHSFHLLVTYLQITSLLLLFAVHSGLLYCFEVSMSSLLRDIYGLNIVEAGLCFLPAGLGCILGAIFNGKFLNWEFRRLSGRYRYEIRESTDLRDFPLEIARFRLIPMHIFMCSITVLIYSWSLDKSLNLAVALVTRGLFGFSFMGINDSISIWWI